MDPRASSFSTASLKLSFTFEYDGRTVKVDGDLSGFCTNHKEEEVVKLMINKWIDKQDYDNLIIG